MREDRMPEAEVEDNRQRIHNFKEKFPKSSNLLSLMNEVDRARVAEKRLEEALESKYNVLKGLQKTLLDICHELDERCEYWLEEHTETFEELDRLREELNSAIFSAPNYPPPSGAALSPSEAPEKEEG